MKKTVNFDAFAVGAAIVGSENWVEAVAGVGMGGLLLVPDPLVAEDADGKYLDQGHTVMGAGDLAPEGHVTQIGVSATLDSGDLLRIVLPYNELVGELDDSDSSAGIGPFDSLQYLTIEGQRTSSSIVRLSAYLNDPIVGHTHYLIARSYLETSSSRVFFVAETGRRYARAWWFTERERFLRQPPDLGAYVPDMECLTWGLMTQGGKIRSVSIDTDPTHPREYYSIARSDVEVDDPDAVGPLGSGARACLATYTPLRHMRRARAATSLVGSGPSATGNISDWTWRRVDPQQSLLLIDATTVRVSACSLEQGVTGPAGAVVTVTPSEDPGGSADGGIGSGRSDLGPGGELVIDTAKPPDDRTTGEYSTIDEVTDTGGGESLDRYASRQAHAWNLSFRMKPADARRIQKVVAAAGGARSVWVPAPFAPEPVAAYIDGAEFRLLGPKRLQGTVSATEA